MQTIETKYLGATNYRGSRIKATQSAMFGNDFKPQTATVDYSHALNLDQNHQEAARKLKLKLGWQGEMYGGTTSRGMAWVFVNDSTATI